MKVIMRYPKDHKETTRRRIVGSAAQTLRRDGIVASGVIGLMADAGLTQGGFYTHFASKDALVDEALQLAMVETRRKFSRLVADARAEGRSAIIALIDGYLSERHLEAPGMGCLLSSLGAELARQPEPIRRTAERAMNELIELIASEVPAPYQGRAGAILGLLSGTLQLARLGGTRNDQRALLDQGRSAAYVLAGVEMRNAAAA
jgi:TetR/AcrR family transcriptional regulator, transcriptional repressor for nem operon